MQKGNWYNAGTVNGQKYNCGFCSTLTSPSRYYYTIEHGTGPSGCIYICANCNKPTYITNGVQSPGPVVGRDIKHLPLEISNLYEEARKCISVGANTSSVLACRKLLMNVAVQEGAEQDKSFQYYVNYLEANNYLPPKGKDWVDKIRQKGNEATHEIAPMSLQDATELIGFVEMLLRFVYEFPGMVSPQS
jgi:hypothetical protein